MDGRNQTDTKVSFWTLHKKNEISTVKSYNNKNPITTSYALLWKEVKNSDSISSVSLQNAMRRILENFFGTLGNANFGDILKYFDGRIASKLLLGEAIDRNLLSSFQYFGVTDDTDYRNFKWTRGKYDVSELEKVYTADTRRCALILNSVKKYVTDISSVKGLGFCVSVAHAN